MLLVQGAFTAAEARKGYLTRMQKRGSVTRAKVPEVTDVVPMGKLVLPLNELSADEVRQLLESAYGKENGIEVTRPGNSAKGVIVVAPRDELVGISGLIKQAEPSDLDFLRRVQPRVPKHIVSKEDLIANHPPKAYALMRKRAVEHLKTEKPSWGQRFTRSSWQDGSKRRSGWHGKRFTRSSWQNDRIKTGRSAVRLYHAEAPKVATEMQPLFDESDVRIEAVNGANIILITGTPSVLANLRESIVQTDHMAAQSTEDEIANRTKYIRRMAGTRNSAFRITRPNKPRIKPLPAITITGDPQPIFENTQEYRPKRLPDYVKPEVDSTSEEKEEENEFDRYFKTYIEESLREANKPRQPTIRRESRDFIDFTPFLDLRNPSSRSTSTYQQGGKTRSTTKQD